MFFHGKLYNRNKETKEIEYYKCKFNRSSKSSLEKSKICKGTAKYIKDSGSVDIMTPHTCSS